jgi:hypothetical protein
MSEAMNQKSLCGLLDGRFFRPLAESERERTECLEDLRLQTQLACGPHVVEQTHKSTECRIFESLANDPGQETALLE